MSDLSSNVKLSRRTGGAASSDWRMPNGELPAAADQSVATPHSALRILHSSPAIDLPSDTSQAHLAAVNLKKNYRKGPLDIPVLLGVDLEVRARRVSGDCRAKRLGKEHVAAFARHAGCPDLRRSAFSRPANRQFADVVARTDSQRSDWHDFSVLSFAAGINDVGKRAGPVDDRPIGLELLAPPRRICPTGHPTFGNRWTGAPVEASTARTLRRRDATGGNCTGVNCPAASAVGRRADGKSRSNHRPRNFANFANLEPRARPLYSHGDARSWNRRGCRSDCAAGKWTSG